METIEYKGYTADITYTSGIYQGQIHGISEVIGFECNDSAKLEEEFKRAVEDYLEYCKAVGKEPEICK